MRNNKLMAWCICVLFSAAAITGCKKAKEDDNTPPVEQSGETMMVKRLTRMQNSIGVPYTVTYTYDSLNRLTDFHVGGVIDSQLYSYSCSYLPGLVIRHRYNNTSDTSYLNAQGYDNSLNYDADGHVLPDPPAYDHWVGGNLVFSVSKTGDTAHFTYVPGKLNSIDYPNRGMHWLGIGSANPTLSDSKTGITHTYAFDAKGRIITDQFLDVSDKYLYY